MRKCVPGFSRTAVLLIGLLVLPAVAMAQGTAQEWTLVNPEGVIKVEPMKVNAHPATLEGKTVLLRWNGKHNGNNFLDRVGELLVRDVKNVKIIKSWQVAPDTAIIAGNPDRSQAIVQKLSAPKPDLVIGSQCD